MNALFTAAKEVCDFITARRWKYCIIGGLAVQRWGKLRTTLDVDLTLFTGFGEEEKYVVMKVFAARGKDLHDAETIAIRQKLDRGYILRQLKPLCELKEAPELVEQARRILEKHTWRA